MNMFKDQEETILRQSPEPPAYLVARILHSIQKEEQKKLHRQIAVSGTLLCVSLGSSVASIMNFGTELSHSGFISFISLFGSDFSFAAMDLREIFFSLVESFPAVAAALCAASVAFALWFGMSLIKEAGTIRRNKLVMRPF
jgi:hypothetical protein